MDIFITLDYELALGPRTGTPINCLVKPMDEIMKVMEKHDIRLTLMVDGAYLFRMEQLKDNNLSLQREYQTVIDNLKLIHEKGHSLQYHFHPQWLFSEFKKNTWLLDFDHYKLSDVPLEILRPAFKKGMDIIEEITGKRPIAFRAGGFSLCGYRYYGPLFQENGILLDTSVRIGEREISKFQSYDFTTAPDKTLYFFNDDVTKEVTQSKNTFMEMPITSSKPMFSPLYILKKRRYSKLLKPHIKYGDGLGVGFLLNKFQNIRRLLTKLKSTIRIQASIDGFGSVALIDVYNDCEKRGLNQMVVIGHPKSATDSSIKYLDRFINEMKIQGNIFKTFEEIDKGK